VAEARKQFGQFAAYVSVATLRCLLTSFASSKACIASDLGLKTILGEAKRDRSKESK
jgi:hypothetical protein